MHLKKNNFNRSNSLMQYMGLAAQFFASIGIALFLGYEADAFFVFKNPWFIWILPLVVIIFTLIRLIIDTSKKEK